MLIEVEKLFGEIIGLKPSRVKTGHGSFLTLDFGQLIPSEVKTRSVIKTTYFGEWYLWVYMCAWRIDRNNHPVVGSDDPKEMIEKCVNDLEWGKLSKANVLNSTFDAKFEFDNDVILYLFSNKISEHLQWVFYDRDGKVFVAGPGDKWAYKTSS